jgi:hypothetical protein
MLGAHISRESPVARLRVGPSKMGGEEHGGMPAGILNPSVLSPVEKREPGNPLMPTDSC